MKSGLFIAIRVLQNGHPVAEEIRQVRRFSSFAISSSFQKLGLPFYPLIDQIRIARVDAQRRVFLSLDMPFKGYIRNREKFHRLESIDHAERNYSLKEGDYACLQMNDLKVLVRIGRLTTAVSKFPLDRSYHGSLQSMVIKDRQEGLALGLGILVSALILAATAAAFLSYKPKIESKLEELHEAFVIPFIHRDNLATIPEALKFNLDRRSYVSATIQFYDSFADMMMGWPIDKEAFLYQESVLKQRAIVKDRLSQKSAMVEKKENESIANRSRPDVQELIVPAIYGETLGQNLAMITDKVKRYQDGLKIAIDYRRHISKSFLDDSIYDWNNYTSTSKKHTSESVQALSKIKVFNQLSNEQQMYHVAETLALRAEYQRRQLRYSERPLRVSNSFVTLPTGLSLVDFNHEKSLRADNQVPDQLQGSTWDRKDDKIPIEPIIGQIDPQQIDATVERNRFQLRACYEIALRRNHEAKGQTEWIFRVDSRGIVSDIELVRSTVRDRQMIECVQKKIASWSFPAPKKGSIKVNHVFEFKPRSG